MQLDIEKRLEHTYLVNSPQIHLSLNLGCLHQTQFKTTNFLSQQTLTKLSQQTLTRTFLIVKN
jgi:hypothetical protein